MAGRWRAGGKLIMPQGGVSAARRVCWWQDCISPRQAFYEIVTELCGAKCLKSTGIFATLSRYKLQGKGQSPIATSTSQSLRNLPWKLRLNGEACWRTRQSQFSLIIASNCWWMLLDWAWNERGEAEPASECEAVSTGNNLSSNWNTGASWQEKVLADFTVRPRTGSVYL